jgi:hypothetical protein
MKLSLSILLVAIGISLPTGCFSSKQAKFESTVHEWVPLGTTVAEAKRIMERHGFECHLITTNNPFNSLGLDYLDCDAERVRFHDWSARFIFQDGKVSAYGPITAD